MNESEQADQKQRSHKLHVVLLLARAIGLALPIVGCILAWSASRSPLDSVIVPGATSIQVQSYGLGSQRITYTAPGAPYGWYFTIVRNLSAHGWSAPVTSNRGIQNVPEVHWRISSFWFVYVEETVALQGDPYVAHIMVQRVLIIPWRRFLF